MSPPTRAVKVYPMKNCPLSPRKKFQGISELGIPTKCRAPWSKRHLRNGCSDKPQTDLRKIEAEFNYRATFQDTRLVKANIHRHHCNIQCSFSIVFLCIFHISISLIVKKLAPLTTSFLKCCINAADATKLPPMFPIFVPVATFHPPGT